MKTLLTVSIIIQTAIGYFTYKKLVEILYEQNKMMVNVCQQSAMMVSHYNSIDHLSDAVKFIKKEVIENGNRQ